MDDANKAKDSLSLCLLSCFSVCDKYKLNGGVLGYWATPGSTLELFLPICSEVIPGRFRTYGMFGIVSGLTVSKVNTVYSVNFSP